MTFMFYRCSSLTTLDLSSFNTSNVKDMWNAFGDCSALTTIYVSANFTTAQASGWDMFSGCTSLVGGSGTKFNNNYTDETYARIDRAGTPGYFTAK